MRTATWNMSLRAAGEPPGLSRRPHRDKPGGSLAVCLVLVSALLGSSAELRAADEPPGPFLFVSSTRTPRDIEIEAKVRRALREDAQLRPLNLGVHVNGGIASLSGPVPTAELKQRAVAIVQRIENVLTVSSKDLYVSVSDQGAKRLSVLIPDDRPTKTRSASPGSPVGDTGQQITLLAPETVAPTVPKAPSPNIGKGTSAGTRLTANPHQNSPDVSLSAAIENLRRRETRYHQIRAQVRGTTVYLFSGGTASEDVMTFAQAVRRLPGVQHVIMTSDPR